MSKGKARTFGQDLMRGEHIVGGRKVGNKPPKPGETASLKGGLTHGTTMHPYDGNGGSRRVAPAGLTTGEIAMDGAPQSGTSIFDPVLCELAYRWFCPPGGLILDPFAGGSVRGIVASKLGRHYIGIDLRPEQIAANRAQGLAICDADMQPEWIEGDSQNLHALIGNDQQPADFIFSCPPYADLEVYSDDSRDLSTMAYEEFRAAYGKIIKAAAERLADNRFACFVVGDVRDKHGMYRNFPAHTTEAFHAAGLRLYNEVILITAAGSLPIRAGKQFEATRKLGKTHQNVLVYVKGDPRKAVSAIGKVEFGEMNMPAEDQPLPNRAPISGGQNGSADPDAAYGERL